MSLGVIVAGDFALATGADRHLAFVANELGKTGRAIACAWIVPGDRVTLAATLHEAWQRPYPVVCFGGLGDGVDDHMRVTLAALQIGREAVGLHRLDQSDSETHSGIDVDTGGFVQCGNVACFHGDPAVAHPAFRLWLRRQAAGDAAETLATEQVRWTLPESLSAAAARRATRQAFPMVAQRLLPSPDGALTLSFCGLSKGKVQRARKMLQRELKSG